MKTCSKCKEIKLISEFYKDRRNKDGIHSCCKSCIKACNKSYRQSKKGRAYQKAYQQQYLQTPNGKAAMKRFYARNPNYRKAVDAVNDAIQAGRLHRANTQLCHYCPEPAQQYHHWHGYEPECWLDVVPACAECHTKEHRKIA